MVKKGKSTDGRFKKGHSGGPGRPKGARNKITRSMVDDVLQAYKDLGGVEYLVRLGKSKKDRPLFVAMLKRLVPNETKTKMEVAAVIQRPDIVAPGQVGAKAARKAAEDAKRSVGRM